MFPSFCAILEPRAPQLRTRRAGQQFMPPERDAIPVITMRGRRLAVRPIVPVEASLLVDLLARLSARSAQLRFFRPLTSKETLWREAARVAVDNPQQHVALAATAVADGAERAVALAELAHDHSDPAVAEFAIVVRDDYQQEGLGRMLTQLLIQVALLRGVDALRVEMLAENRAVRKLVYGLGLPYIAQTRYGEIAALLTLRQG